jgi:hypothetical protein
MVRRYLARLKEKKNIHDKKRKKRQLIAVLILQTMPDA